MDNDEHGMNSKNTNAELYWLNKNWRKRHWEIKRANYDQ